MADQNTAIVLGGTLPHISLIEKLQRRGFFVVLIDYYDNPPAKKYADQHIKESTLDHVAVLNIARELNARLVISSCIDQANVTACFVGEKLNLPIPYSYDAALKVTKKPLMKAVMQENGIPTARYIVCEEKSELDVSELRWPLIVKPSDSNSSKGIHKVEEAGKLDAALDVAKKFSRDNKVIVEEFLEGVELGLDFVLIDGKAVLLTTKTRRKIASKEQQILGCYWPDALNAEKDASYEQLATKIAESFHLSQGPLMLQVIETPDRIDVIEFGARIGGGESFRLVEKVSTVDYVETSINSFLGEEIRVEPQKSDKIYCENFLYTNGGVFSRIQVDEALLTEGIIDFYDTYKVANTKVGPELSSNNRVGVFVVSGPSKKAVNHKIKAALKRIDVMGLNDESIIRRDIYV